MEEKKKGEKNQTTGLRNRRGTKEQNTINLFNK
jgi:hypothetical protein